MIQNEFLEKTLDVFIRYGFRKTSMDDIATAVGLSRQAIYKRYGNKEALFKTVVDASVIQFFANAREALTQPDKSIHERIFDSCNCSTGKYIDKMRSSPHSSEVIAMADSESSDLMDEYDAAYQETMAELLLNEKVFTDKEAANDAVSVLHYASKGLFHEAKNQKEYTDGMDRVIRTVIPTDSKRK